MLAENVINLAKAAEVKQLGQKDDAAAILGYLNLGILELHKRFLLWEGEAIITQALGVNLYEIKDGDANVTVDLTGHELLKVERIYDADGNQCVLNNNKAENSIYIPRPHQVKITTPTAGETLDVIYRAAPAFITDITTEHVPLPIQFLEPLFIYMAYKAHTSIKSRAKDENNVHYQRFDAACKLIESQSLDIADDLSSTKFYDRGFV